MGKNGKKIKFDPPTPRLTFFQSLLYELSAYTEKEMHQRSKILTLRSASEIDESLLSTDEPWFKENEELAFKIENADSWFLKKTYTPRTSVVPENFHIGLSNQKVIWKGISVLRLKIADYLIDRTKLYPTQMLNEPIHFVYLDLIQILSRLSISPDAEFVASQIPRVSQYIRQINSFLPGSDFKDKLFIDNCRISLNAVLENDIARQLDSTQLNNILSQAQAALEELGEQYHVMLHFAYMSKPINEHPYWVLYQERTIPDKQHLFPTSIGQQCLTSDEIQPFTGDRSSFTMAIPSCPELPIHPDLSEKQQALYFKNLRQLEEIIHLKQMLLKAQHLIEQTGEMFTMMMFRENLINLFEHIDHFFIKTHHSMLEMLDDNEELYHNSIIQREDLSFWQKITSNRKQLLDQYISNQEELTRFSITKQSLDNHRVKVRELLFKAKSQLASFEDTQNDRLLDAKEEAHNLLSAIYDWLMNQHYMIGLPKPEKPSLLLTDGFNVKNSELPTTQHRPSMEDLSSNTHDHLYDYCDDDEQIDRANNKPFFNPSCSTNVQLPSQSNICFFQPEHHNPLLIENRQSIAPPRSLINNTSSSGQLLLISAVVPGLILLVLVLFLFFKNRPERDDVNIESDEAEESNRFDCEPQT